MQNKIDQGCPCDDKLHRFCAELESHGSSMSQKCGILLNVMDLWESNSQSEDDIIYSKLSPVIQMLLERFWEIRKPVPRSNGHWNGERGNSVFYFDEDYLPKKDTRNGLRWGELVAKYKNDFSLDVDGGVRYSSRRIDLSPYTIASVKISYEKSDMSKLCCRGGSANTIQRICAPLFESALENEIKQGGYNDFWEFKDGIHNGIFIRDTPLVIHEDYDGQTMSLVPKYLHDNWKHYGGVALARAIYEVLY